MPSLRSFGALVLKPIQIAAKGRASLAALLYGRANAQLERLAGIAPPNGGNLQYAGHDHGAKGGHPLPRGLRWGFDVGEETGLVLNFDGSTLPFNAKAPFCENRPAMGISASTPGLTGTAIGGAAAKLEAQILVEIASISGSLYLYLYNGATASYSSASGAVASTGFHWLHLTDVPFLAGSNNLFLIEAEATAACNVNLRACAVAETRTRTQPQVSAGSVFSSVGRPT